MTSRAVPPRARRRRRIFLLDDHPLVREWLADFINQQADLRVCGQSEGSEGCIDVLEKSDPDVAVVDISLREDAGFDLIGEIKMRIPRVKIIVLTMRDSPRYARLAFRAGATGYVVKRETTHKICTAIRNVLDDTPYICHEPAPPPESTSLTEPIDFSLLSDRELEMFYFLGIGKSTRQIAERLGISIKTVQVHCHHISKKLEIHGSSELLSAAVRWNERHEMQAD